MPKLVHNSWAWWRAYLSGYGPVEGRVRLTLDGYMRCMHPDGRGSWPGVRRVGELTGQKKDTVLRYRAEALELGWLVLAPTDQARQPGEVWASVPDHVPMQARYLVPAVWQDRSARPATSDRTPHNSLPTPEEALNPDKSRKAEELARKREPQLRTWLAADSTARHYRGDSDSLARLTPIGLRFEGYAAVIREVEESLRRPSSEDPG